MKISRPHGMIDALLVVGLLYCAYAHTTIGAITARGVGAAMGHRHLPSVFDTYQGRDNRVSLESPHLSLKQTASLNNAHLLMVSTQTGLPIRMLQAAVLAHGRCDKSRCLIKTPYSIGEPTSTISIELYAKALLEAAKKVGNNHEAALEALYVGIQQVIHAIERAEQAGMQQPLDVEVHAFYFSPLVRRGPLQDAIEVLTHYRLLSLVWPIEMGQPIASGYGYRIHPILKKKRFHNGVDLAAPAGTPVRSAQHGRVQRCAKDSISGRYVLLDHGFGIQTIYCHLSNIVVKTNQIVQQGQTLGHIGSTGRSTGPHLHYSLRLAGKTVDPTTYGYQSGQQLAD